MSDIVATLVLLRREDEILLAMKKRGFGKGYWNGPGGKVEPGESLEQAMIRECQEEIGVVPTRFHKVAEHDFVLDSATQPWHIYGHVYLCHEWQGEPHETEEMAPRWFKTTNIPYGAMWQDDIYWLPLVLSGTLLKTRFTFDAQNNLVSHRVEEVERL